MNDLLGAGILLGLFALLAVGIEGLARRSTLHPEIPRKLLHLGGGLGCLFFPLLIQSAWTVLALAAFFGFVFWIGERNGWLRSLSRVQRKSRGGLYYPFAVAAVFSLTPGRYGLYLACILVLAFSDSAAALVGVRFGRVRFRVGTVAESKSLEGALMFWVISLLAVFLPLRWVDGAEPLHALLAAFLVACILAAVEAVSWRGIDNLYVPILGALVLLKVTFIPTSELIVQSISLVVLAALLLALNRFARMVRTRGLILVSLMVYAVWALGSAMWAAPFLACFALFALVFHLRNSNQRPTRVYRRVALAASPAVILCAVANLTGTFSFFYGPYLIALLIPFCWGLVVQTASPGRPPLWRWSGPQFSLALASSALVLVIARLFQPSRGVDASLLLPMSSLPLTWCGLWIFDRFPVRSGGRQVLSSTLVGIGLSAGLQLTGAVPCWAPTRWADRYQREPAVLLPLPESWFRPHGGLLCK